jgi:HEAT repeat protein
MEVDQHPPLYAPVITNEGGAVRPRLDGGEEARKFLQQAIAELRSGDERRVTCALKSLCGSFVQEHHQEMKGEGVTSWLVRLLTPLVANSVTPAAMASALPALRQATALLWELAAFDDNKVGIVDAGCVPVLVRLLQQPLFQDTQLRKNASGIMWYLTRETENDRRIAEQGGLNVLLQLLADRSQHEEVHKHAVVAMANLTQNQDNKVLVAKIGGIEILVQFLVSGPTRSSFVLKNTAACLAHLALNNDNKLKIAQCGGIEVLSMLLSYPEDVQVDATAALWNLAVNDENKSRMAQLGAIEQLIRLLSSTNETIQFKAVGTLSNLTFNDENKVRFARSGGIPPLLKLLSGSPDDVQKLAALILWNLALDDDNKVKIGELGGIVALIRLLTSHNEDIQKNAICVIVNLAINNANKIKIAQEAGIERIIKLLTSKNRHIHKNAAGALWNLALNDENQVKIAALGGIPPLIDLLRSEHDDVQIDAAGALWNLALNYDNQISIAAQGGIQLLIKLLGSTNPEVQKVAAGALANISANSVLSEVIVFEGALRVIGDAFRSDDASLFHQLIMIMKNLAVHKSVRLILVKHSVHGLLRAISSNNALCTANVMPIFDNLKPDDLSVMLLVKSEVAIFVTQNEQSLQPTMLKQWTTQVISKLSKKESIYLVGNSISSMKPRLKCHSAILLAHLIQHNKYAREFKKQIIEGLVWVLHHWDDALIFKTFHSIRYHLERALAFASSSISPFESPSSPAKISTAPTPTILSPQPPHHHHLRHRQYHVDDKSDAADVVFMVEGQLIYAHKCILRKKSQYFDTMFSFNEKNILNPKGASTLSGNILYADLQRNGRVSPATVQANGGGNVNFNEGITDSGSDVRNFDTTLASKSLRLIEDDGSYRRYLLRHRHHKDSTSGVTSSGGGCTSPHRGHDLASEVITTMRNVENQTIKIVDVSYEVFLRLLTLLYTDKVTPFKGWEDAIATLVAADRYGVYEFIVPCSRYLRDHINAGTFSSMFDLSIGHDFSKLLQQECLRWLLKTCEEMADIKEVKDFIDLDMLIQRIEVVLHEIL